MPSIVLRRRVLGRLIFIVFSIIILRWIFLPSPSTNHRTKNSNGASDIKHHNFIERATHADRTLNARKHPFLQARIGRDADHENHHSSEGAGLQPDWTSEWVEDGVMDFWNRFQRPYITGHETASMDSQHVLSAIEQLLALNGWVAANCPTLIRPFTSPGLAQDTAESFSDLIEQDHLYYIAVVVHSADHFLVDQLAVIVQMAKRLGSQNLFVSMLDYASSDSTETLVDLCEAVLTLLNVPFRIRRVHPMTEEPTAAYYPLEESYMRNLALEPLHELRDRRKIEFKRVIWLKGFTCPNDILESIKISFVNEASMVCGMDWAESAGFFLFSDRWRTRDIEGNQFRQSRSSSRTLASVPPRDDLGSRRYTEHLPFQVFCCESGTHVVDPAQSYYRGVKYRSGDAFTNSSDTSAWEREKKADDGSCLDSSQSWFCRDLWVASALDEDTGTSTQQALPIKHERRQEAQPPPEVPQAEAPQRAAPDKPDADANAGSDYDAIPDEPVPPLSPPADQAFVIPNNVFRPAKILVNPRCVTTYAGVSHAKLAQDLFGDEDIATGDGAGKGKGNQAQWLLEDWEGAPESFVCQEQRTTGGREAPKSQRRLSFSINDEVAVARLRRGKPRVG